MAGEPNPFHDTEVTEYLDSQAERIAEPEVVIRVCLSFIQERFSDPNDGHAVMVAAALRGALHKDRD